MQSVLWQKKNRSHWHSRVNRHDNDWLEMKKKKELVWSCHYDERTLFQEVVGDGKMLIFLLWWWSHWIVAQFELLHILSSPALEFVNWRQLTAMKGFHRVGLVYICTVCLLQTLKCTFAEEKTLDHGLAGICANWAEDHKAFRSTFFFLFFFLFYSSRSIKYFLVSCKVTRVEMLPLLKAKIQGRMTPDSTMKREEENKKGQHFILQFL